MTAKVFEELRESMDRHTIALEKSFSKIRTGRASLLLLDGIKIDYYGSPTPLNQVAALSIPEPQMIIISPWDKTAIGAIEKAIQRSELGLTPTNDGKVVRINIPPLTEERRKELVKVVRKIAEECKIKLRNTRRDANNDLKKLKADSIISEDELFKHEKEVQKITDDWIKKTDDILASKEVEIMQI
ncbi:MAG: ribosome recycling factor [Deltaproteobacteria bacterium]|nr:ribosome recycling factor [Deltaproteobacteria bacterium]